MHDPTGASKHDVLLCMARKGSLLGLLDIPRLLRHSRYHGTVAQPSSHLAGHPASMGLVTGPPRSAAGRRRCGGGTAFEDDVAVVRACSQHRSTPAQLPPEGSRVARCRGRSGRNPGHIELAANDGVVGFQEKARVGIGRKDDPDRVVARQERHGCMIGHALYLGDDRPV